MSSGNELVLTMDQELAMRKQNRVAYEMNINREFLKSEHIRDLIPGLWEAMATIAYVYCNEITGACNIMACVAGKGISGEGADFVTWLHHSRNAVCHCNTNRKEVLAKLDERLSQYESVEEFDRDLKKIIAGTNFNFNAKHILSVLCTKQFRDNSAQGFNNPTTSDSRITLSDI